MADRSILKGYLYQFFWMKNTIAKEKDFSLELAQEYVENKDMEALRAKTFQEE